MTNYKMKTRNKTILSTQKNNKTKTLSKTKKAIPLKSKETVKDASYRDSHNIGRRKSTSSVVTYSLDSRLFFDVYAKFNNENLPKSRNVYNGLYDTTSPSKNKIDKKSTDSTNVHLTPKKQVKSDCFSDLNIITSETESIKKPARMQKVSYEAKSINSDEACIPSPKLPIGSPLKSSKLKLRTIKNNHSIENRVISTRNSKSTEIIINEIQEIPLKSTKNETFQKLLDNKTVFKKHLSQNFKEKKKLKSISQQSSPTDRRLSKRLNKSTIECDDTVESMGECSKSPIKEKINKTIKTKESIQSESEISPLKHGKRIASLNAAAIINCVQNLFNEPNKKSPTRQTKRRVSKSYDNLHNSPKSKDKIEIIEINRDLYEEKLECSTSKLLSSRPDKKNVSISESTSLKISDDIPIEEPITKETLIENNFSESKPQISKSLNCFSGVNGSPAIGIKIQKRKSTATFFDITTKGNCKQKDLSNTSTTSFKKTPKSFTVEPLEKKKKLKEECKKSFEICIKPSIKEKKGGKKINSHQEDDRKHLSVLDINEEDDIGDSLWQWEGEPTVKMIQLELTGPFVERTCYYSIRHARDDIVIRAMDCVMLRSNADQEPFLAKITVFYVEEETNKKMMTLLWYYRPEHTEQGRLAWHTDSDVYASRHLDNNSVECIEDKAFVLPVELYSRFMAYQKRQSSSTRPGLVARLIPANCEDTVLADVDENKASGVLGDTYSDMFISSLYYIMNFQNSFPVEMTTSNVFVCRGLYDITQHKITRNILQNVITPKQEPLEPCESIDSAMSISSCESELDIKEESINNTNNNTSDEIVTSISNLPIPPPPPISMPSIAIIITTTIESTTTTTNAIESKSNTTTIALENFTNNCLPPISSFQHHFSKSQTETIVPASKSCPPPPISKPIQPPLPLSTNGDITTSLAKQPNGHP